MEVTKTKAPSTKEIVYKNCWNSCLETKTLDDIKINIIHINENNQRKYCDEIINYDLNRYLLIWYRYNHINKDNFFHDMYLSSKDEYNNLAKAYNVFMVVVPKNII